MNTSDEKKSQIARAQKLRRKIDEIEKAGENQMPPRKKTKESPRAFVHRRMRELDKDQG